MSSLTSRSPEQTYGDLLHIENGGGGIPTNGHIVVQDGLGNNSALSIGLAGNGVIVDSTLTVNGKLTATGGIAGLQGAIGFVMDGGGVPIQPGLEMDIEVPFNCTINHMTLLANVQGSIQLDIWSCPLSAYPPSSSNSIVGSSYPTISSAYYAEDAALVGWNTTLAQGQILRAIVKSATTITRITTSLLVTKE